MIPIYSSESVNYSAEDAIALFFSVGNDVVCTAQPTGCCFSATFIVDLSKLSHRDDIRADDHGAWKNCGVRSTYCSIALNSDGHVRRVKKMAKPSVMRHSIYRLKRTYWQHGEDTTFCRRLFELEGTLYYFSGGRRYTSWPLTPFAFIIRMLHSCITTIIIMLGGAMYYLPNDVYAYDILHAYSGINQQTGYCIE